jgi:hypothetical protein
MTEHNLTWEEAKEAMKRGAICKGNIHNKYRWNNSCFEVFAELENRWVTHPLLTLGCHMDKWLIVELTDCEIINKHFTLDCTTHGGYAFKFMDEYSPELKRHCIQKFTEQLKQDMDNSCKIMIHKSLELQPRCIVHGFEFNNLSTVEETHQHCLEQCNLLQKSHSAELKACQDYYYKLEEQKMQEPVKTYSFEEAIAGMKAGKFYQAMMHDAFSICVYRIFNNRFQYFSNDRNWEIAKVKLDDMLCQDFIEVENPEKKEIEKKGNELKLSLNDISLDSCGNGIEVGAGGDDVLMTYAKNREIAINWDKALATFMRLKAHPLAKRIEYKMEQFIISVSQDIERCLIIDCYDKETKSTLLSPCFKSEKDARQSIKDIGEDNIIEMFKTFSGLYE